VDKTKTLLLGDQIMKINKKSVVGLRLSDALTLLKVESAGKMKILI
jgi:C-terminal processing protease CtpA/Prc